MTMLTGIRAFEACWQSIKESTSSAENRLLMQSMGRLVDNYATQAEIAEELPAALRGPFGRLVNAYLNGYWLKDAEIPRRPVMTPAMLAAKHFRQRQYLQPTAASEAATYIVYDSPQARLGSRHSSEAGATCVA